MSILFALLVSACTEVPPVLDLAEGWKKSTSEMATPRTEVAAVFFKGKIHVVGGFDERGEVLRSHEAYNPGADAWSELGDFPTPIHHGSLVTDGKSLWLVGGYRANGSATERIMIWKGGSDWDIVATLPLRRAAAAVAFVEGRIHVAGGVTTPEVPTGVIEPELTARHDAWDPASEKWEELAPLPEARDHLAGAAGLGGFAAIGGRKLGLDTNSDRVEVFRNGVWTEGPRLEVASSGLGAAADGRTIYIAGGEGPSSTIANAQLFLADGRGGFIDPMLTPRHGLGVVVGGGALWTVAGGKTPGLSVTGLVEYRRLSNVIIPLRKR